MLFSIVAAPISIPTNSVRGFRRLTFDATIKNDSLFSYVSLVVLLLGFAIYTFFFMFNHSLRFLFSLIHVKLLF